uniref:C2H2-type domain-containing protein n=1 Tax=Trichogramma kaykai TaxID=54128 RepID=A0ABD2XKY1_9HYME
MQRLCDMCEKKFGQKSDLFRHKKTIHERRKDYSCDKCKKKFGQKSYLHVHLKTVHEGQRDYACKKCEKKFGIKANLLTHLKTVHKKSQRLRMRPVSEEIRTEIEFAQTPKDSSQMSQRL